jgi:hypothetical protein
MVTYEIDILCAQKMPDQKDSDAISKMAPNHMSSLQEAKEEEEENGRGLKMQEKEKSGNQFCKLFSRRFLQAKCPTRRTVTPFPKWRQITGRLYTERRRRKRMGWWKMRGRRRAGIRLWLS